MQWNATTQNNNSGADGDGGGGGGVESLSAAVPGGVCAPSLQVIALLGASLSPPAAPEDGGASPTYLAPRLLHVDVSGDACRLPSINIPDLVVPQGRPAPPPPVVANYDLTGMGAGAFEELIEDQESGVSRRTHGALVLMLSLVAAGWLRTGGRRHV